jgi:hypothetical protein
MICLTTQLPGPATTLPSYALSAKLASRNLPIEFVNVICTYNDAPDDPSATSTGRSTVYKWKHPIFAAKSPIKLANLQHTSLLISFLHPDLNKFEKFKMPPASCALWTTSPKTAVLKFAVDDLLTPEFTLLGVIKIFQSKINKQN